jgi:glutaminyl-peptide cyclotransferase
MLLDLAEALNPLLDSRMRRIKEDTADEDEIDAAKTTLQLVFFDGEEAFKDWTATDSVYGARSVMVLYACRFIELFTVI